jgi:hypothetical protein
MVATTGVVSACEAATPPTPASAAQGEPQERVQRPFDQRTVPVASGDAVGLQEELALASTPAEPPAVR